MSSIAMPTTSPIPDLSGHLAYPHMPWRVNPHLFHRLHEGPSNLPFRECQVYPTDQDAFDLVAKYFFADKPTNRTIREIRCIHHSSRSAAFEMAIENLEIEANNPIFKPSWHQEPHAPLRRKVMDRFKAMSDPYSKIQIPKSNRVDSYPNVFIAPVWHGSNIPKSQSICTSGFTIFGKHEIILGLSGANPNTDAGFFGSAVYTTTSARYAAKYGSELLLSWVIARPPYPVVDGDMAKLSTGLGNYKNYSTNYIPVRHVGGLTYFPCDETQVPCWDEIASFNSDHVLVRFRVIMEPEIVISPTNYTAIFLAELENLIIASQTSVYPALIQFLNDKKQLLKQTIFSQEEKLFFKWTYQQFFDASGNIDPAKVNQFFKKAYYDVSELNHLIQHLPIPPDHKRDIVSLIAYGGGAGLLAAIGFMSLSVLCRDPDAELIAAKKAIIAACMYG